MFSYFEFNFHAICVFEWSINQFSSNSFQTLGDYPSFFSVLLNRFLSSNSHSLAFRIVSKGNCHHQQPINSAICFTIWGLWLCLFLRNGNRYCKDVNSNWLLYCKSLNMEIFLFSLKVSEALLQEKQRSSKVYYIDP